MCGAELGDRWWESDLGRRFCTAHQDWLACRLCAVPVSPPQPDHQAWAPGQRRPADHRGPDTDPYCGECGRTAVGTARDLRRTLPTVRTGLHAMGLRMTFPVRIRLAGAAEIATVLNRAHGTTLGVTLIVNGCATGVVVLAGLPFVLFGATVAHESMHVWLSQRKFSHLPPVVEEGLCELAAYEWLRRQPDPRARLIERQIADSPLPIYGEGFRAARTALAGRGMRALLHHVRTHGALP